MTEQFTGLLETLKLSFYPWLVALAPKLIAAVLLLLAAWVIARSARWMARRAAQTEWLERLLLRSGVLAGLVEPSRLATRRLVDGVIYWSILLAGAVCAVAVLSDEVARHLAAVVVILMPRLFLAVAILTAAWWLGKFWSRAILIWLTNEEVAYPWRWAGLVRWSVTAGGIALASEATGFAVTLIRSTFLILLAGTVFALAGAAMPMIRVYLTPVARAKGEPSAIEQDDPLVR